MRCNVFKRCNLLYIISESSSIMIWTSFRKFIRLYYLLIMRWKKQFLNLYSVQNRGDGGFGCLIWDLLTTWQRHTCRSTNTKTLTSDTSLLPHKTLQHTTNINKHILDLKSASNMANCKRRRNNTVAGSLVNNCCRINLYIVPNYNEIQEVPDSGFIYIKLRTVILMNYCRR